VIGTSTLAGGVSSPVRAGAAVGGVPFVQTHGRGAYAFDAAGRAYVDYLMAYGPLLFGHAHPALTTGLDEIAARGTVFGSTHPAEEHLAERIAGHLPSIERLRFFNTGTEAAMSAFRVARAFTRRSLVVRFAGNYHGHFDAALHGAGASAGSPATAASGIPPAAVADVAVARFNDLADVDRVLKGRRDDLAAIVLEPVVGNMGLVPASPSFLDGVFARAAECGALVIFDEVITWLRLGLGGAQTLLARRPDLTILGKTMGGGYPLAALGGRTDVMAALAPEGAAFAGGTFSGNPFSIALGHRTLDLIESDAGLYERLDAGAARLAIGLRGAVARHGLGFPVTQVGSMVDIRLRRGDPPSDYGDAANVDPHAFAAFYRAMLAAGILLAPSPNELMFLSTEHGTAEIDRTIAAADEALAAVGAAGQESLRSSTQST
jgi:glutamate-1-semialdehyde 2,1-aminomutase